MKLILRDLVRVQVKFKLDLVNSFKTPIQQLGLILNKNSYYIKRDDLLPISFGGNKVRKALLFFQDILHKKADCLVTYGASSSNHCRVIANIAASQEIPCYIISPLESSYQTYNKRIVELFGAKIIECPVSDVKDTINLTLEKLKVQGNKPYFIQGGGHGNIGTQAYVDVYDEIKEYEKVQNIFFDYIFLTSGTGTTQAGLVCGKFINNDKRKIIGISNARKNPYGGAVVKESVNDYLSINNHPLIDNEEITFIDDYVLGGYGNYNQPILDTIKETLQNEGIPLDVTYTGKSFWGMREYIKSEQIMDNNILFIHTGGTPLFFDKLEEL